MSKVFTIEEANRTLPLVRRIVSDIVSTHRELLTRAEAYRGLAVTDKSGTELRHLESELRDLTGQVNEYIAELTQIGVQFKGFEGGLVDFHGVLDGRPVLLCWKLGEDSVEWWHEMDAGYAGRQRLPSHLIEQSN